MIKVNADTLETAIEERLPMISATNDPSMVSASWTNDQLAERLEEVAMLLEEQGANPFRVRAYRTGAETLRTTDRPVQDILKSEGRDGLMRLPGIGESLAGAIEQLVTTGQLGLLNRLRGEGDVERLLTTVGGIGPELAKRIHEVLGIETLQDLEAAAYDGRLLQVPGMGAKRIRTIRESLSGRFRRRSTPLSPTSRAPVVGEPPVSELLDIDEEYRNKARAGTLPRIAPRRFNPTRDAWLGILHTQRGPRHYTALFSNTARAHELGATRDWVVIYRDDRDGDGQWTVVTARMGRWKGKRIVRGRERQCAAYYQKLSPAS